MTEPTDAELDAVLYKHWPAFSMQATLVRMRLRAAMRAAIVKWGAPPAEQAAHKAAPAPLIARSLAEWHEQDGNVAWWAWNGREWAGEPAWIGTPNCEDWPGYHTHWTPHPEQPVCAALAAQGGKA